MLKEKLAQGLKVLTDKRYRQFYAQRQILGVPSRERKANSLASRLPVFEAKGADQAAQTAVLKDRGYLFLDNLIKPDQLQAMHGFFSVNECADPYRPALGKFIAPGNAPLQTHVAFFSN